MIEKNKIMYFLILVCLLSGCQTNTGNKKIITYSLFDSWKYSVLKSIENLKVTSDDQYIIDNHKQSLKSIDKHTFDTLISNIKWNKKDNLYVTFNLSEGEVITSTIKVFAVKKTKEIHYSKCLIEATEKKITSGVIDKVYYSRLTKNLKVLSDQETSTTYEDDVLFFTDFTSLDLPRTHYIPINVDNHELLDVLK